MSATMFAVPVPPGSRNNIKFVQNEATHGLIYSLDTASLNQQKVQNFETRTRLADASVIALRSMLCHAFDNIESSRFTALYFVSIETPRQLIPKVLDFYLHRTQSLPVNYHTYDDNTVELYMPSKDDLIGRDRIILMHPVLIGVAESPIVRALEDLYRIGHPMKTITVVVLLVHAATMNDIQDKFPCVKWITASMDMGRAIKLERFIERYPLHE